MSEPTAPEAPPAAPPAPAGEERPQYEFDAAQNEVINNLAVAILWVRVPLMVVAFLQAVIAVGLAFRLEKDGAHIVGVTGHMIASVVAFMLANWLLRAADAFTSVTTTTGRDITHLLTGLKNLGAWFELLAFFVKLYLALLALLVTILLFGLVAGVFREPG